MSHPIDPQVVELIEIMAEQCPDVQDGDCTKEEVIECWTMFFNQHAAAAEKAAQATWANAFSGVAQAAGRVEGLEEAAEICETRAAREGERADSLMHKGSGLRDVEDFHFEKVAETARAVAATCHTLAAEIRLLGKIE